MTFISIHVKRYASACLVDIDHKLPFHLPAITSSAAFAMAPARFASPF